MKSFKLLYDDSSLAYRGVKELDVAMIEIRSNYIIDKLKYRGYIYLNEVYEAFGLNWNPNLDNLCFKDRYGDINITHKEILPNTYEIHITQ